MSQEASTPRSGRPGIADVASLAGVSQGTVSNVLNRPDRVAAPTRAKVERAMLMLDYVPNTLARTLAAGSSKTMGLILADLTNSLFVDVARGAEQAVESEGGNLLLANSDARLDREQSYLRMFVQSRFAGILMTLNDASHYLAIARIAPTATPLVMLNHRADSSRFCSVSVNNELGGYLATRHLIELGRRRLVFVGGPGQLTPVHERSQGFFRAVREAGIHAESVSPHALNRADGWHVGSALLDRPRTSRPDGVVASSDLLAAGILQALSVAPDVSVPADISVVGYDNNHAAWDSPIPITTIAQPGEEMGRRGAVMAAEEDRAESHEHRAEVLEPRLVIRESTSRSIT